MEPKRTCPECNLVFEASPAASGVLTCPLCDAVFAAGAPAAMPFIVPVPPASAPGPSPLTSGRYVLKGCAAVGVAILLVGGLTYAYFLAGGVEQNAAGTPPPPTPSPSSPPSPTPLPSPSPPPLAAPSIPAPPVVVETPPAPFPPSLPAPRPPAPAPRPPRTAAEASPPLSPEDRINRAIDRGLAYLQNNHSGHDQYRNYLGLLGLTLLECGVTAKDAGVRQIAEWLRGRERDLAGTYELSLAILFLDRLGDPKDRPLLRTFGQRLLDGQLEEGAWTYTCPVGGKRRGPAGRVFDPESRAPQTPQIISWKNSAPIGGSAAPLPFAFRGDNSNTQFALLGLWVAQRHGVASRRALLAAEQYFRQTQIKDGSWPYHPRLAAYRDSMTCAGLMGLAMRHGVISGQGRDIRPDQPAQVRDKAVSQGLSFLGRSLNKVALVRGRITGVEARDPLYFLWSLERMAMIYDLRTVGEKAWYPWAASLLVETQRDDGSWSAPYPSPVGTCFALLVLRRSNLARDLQLSVQGQPPRAPAEPTIIQGPEAALESTTAPQRPSAPLGPTTKESKPNP